MSETYVPRPGDIVRFHSWAANMELLGEVLSVAPQSRMANVREDHEEGQTFVKSWDVLKPVQLSGSAMVTRLLDERNEAIQRADNNGKSADSWFEAAKSFARDYRAATESAQRYYDLAKVADLTAQNHKARQASIADERDNWMANSIANHEATKKAEADRDYWKNRAEITHLQHVAANKRANDLEAELSEMTEYAEEVRARSEENYQSFVAERTRAEKAEADLRSLRTSVVDAANSAGYENLSYHYSDTDEQIAYVVGQLAREHDELADRADKAETALADRRDRVANLKASRNEQRARAEKAENEADGLVHRVEELEDQNRVLKSRLDSDAADWQKAAFRNGQRFEAAQRELAELKKALATLAGAEIIPNTLP